MCARGGVCVNVVGNTKRAYGMECSTAYIVILMENKTLSQETMLCALLRVWCSLWSGPRTTGWWRINTCSTGLDRTLSLIEPAYCQ